MKKHYLSAVLLLCSLLASAQNVNIPDANFKAKLLLASPTQGLAFNSSMLNMTVDVNHDGEIQQSEAEQVYILRIINASIASLEGIQYFPNLVEIDVTGNQLTTLDASIFPNLKILKCGNNHLSSLTVNGLTYLETFNCSQNQLTSLNVNGLVHLETFYCFQNQLTALDLTGLNALKSIKCDSNQLTSLDIQEPNALLNLYCGLNQLTSLTVTSDTLNYLDCNTNLLPSLDLTGLPALFNLACNNNLLTSLDLTNSAYAKVDCSYNMLTSLNMGASNIQDANFDLNCSYNNFTALVIPASLYKLTCSYNQLNTLQINGGVDMLDCSYNNLTILNIPIGQSSTYRKFNCSHNQLTALGISPGNGYELNCSYNNLTNLALNNNEFKQLDCSHNQLSGITFKPQIYEAFTLDCSYNQLTNLDLPAVNYGGAFLNCSNNQLETLNLEYFSPNSVDCRNNQLESIFMKDGKHNNVTFWDNPSLAYICADPDEISNIALSLTASGFIHTEVNSYCSYVPGNFYRIVGVQHMDLDMNGCGMADPLYPNLYFNITDGTTSGTIICNNSGGYSIPVQAGTHTITPVFQNNYFTASPASVSVSFPAQASPSIQDFCIVPNGVHPDVEVSVAPMSAAVPGFDAKYLITYTNKGTTVASGSLGFSYDEAVLDFISASPPVQSQAAGSLTWDYSGLQPFQAGTVLVALNLNSPVETPALNQNDHLAFTASINLANDEYLADNAANFMQTVANALDPNDKTCLEGERITPEMVGNYVHYLIRFENSGNYPAQNITVKDVIDTAKFDIGTLVPLSGSHPFITRISGGNQVEFVFENIMLPYEDANNDGYVLFKIRTKPTLALGDTFSNTAGIYFNYNTPVVTNTAVTAVQALGRPDTVFEDYFRIYPNPAKDTLNIASKQGAALGSIQVYNALGQLVIAIPNAQQANAVDVSGLSAGSYFIRIGSDKGNATAKFIKQ